MTRLERIKIDLAFKRADKWFERKYGYSPKTKKD